MSEPVEFKYVNDSLTTQPQAILIAKIASYFHTTNKALRSKLDKFSLSQGVIRFRDTPINTSFYITSFRLNFNELLNTKKFEESKFLVEYQLSRNASTEGALFTIYSAPNIYVLTPFNEVRGEGGIYINYPPSIPLSLLIPLNTYLRRYIIAIEC